MKLAGSSSPSRRSVLKPVSVKTTIGAGRQVDDAVAAFVGDRRARLLDEDRTAGLDGDAGQHRAARVADDAAEGALRAGGRGRQQEGDRRIGASVTAVELPCMGALL